MFGFYCPLQRIISFRARSIILGTFFLSKPPTCVCSLQVLSIQSFSAVHCQMSFWNQQLWKYIYKKNIIEKIWHGRVSGDVIPVGSRKLHNDSALYALNTRHYYVLMIYVFKYLINIEPACRKICSLHMRTTIAHISASFKADQGPWCSMPR